MVLSRIVPISSCIALVVGQIVVLVSGIIFKNSGRTSSPLSGSLAVRSMGKGECGTSEWRKIRPVSDRSSDDLSSDRPVPLTPSENCSVLCLIEFWLFCREGRPARN